MVMMITIIITIFVGRCMKVDAMKQSVCKTSNINDPAIVPKPPRITTKRNRIERCKVKLSGLINPTTAAKNIPPTPVKAAERAKLVTFTLSGFKPIAVAAISSSRTA